MSETAKPATGQPGVEIAEIEVFITRAPASAGIRMCSAGRVRFDEQNNSGDH